MLKEKIYSDLTVAMKAKDSLRLDALRMVKAEVLKHETSGENMIADDSVMVLILTREVKRRKEAAEGFTQGGNTAMAEKEMQEAAIYQAYLPEMMGEEEVRSVVKATMMEMGVSDASGMGKLMGAVMGKLKGKAEGMVVKKVVGEMLGKNC